MFLQVLSAMPQEKYACANLLKHGVDVQDRFYNFSQSGASDARMGGIVSHMWTGTVVPEEVLKPQIKSNIAKVLNLLMKFRRNLANVHFWLM